MGIIAFCIGIALYIVLTGLIFRTFFLTKVGGLSMYPTFKDGDVLLIRPVFTKWEKPKIDNIYIYNKDDRQVVKRLTSIFPTERLCFYHCFFEGDNPPESYDSRHYGTVQWGRIKFKVVTRLFNYKAL